MTVAPPRPLLNYSLLFAQEWLSEYLVKYGFIVVKYILSTGFLSETIYKTITGYVKSQKKYHYEK